MDKNQILDQLKQINYPGFNRDIVSFGMVQDVVIDQSTITIILAISSSNEEKKNQLVQGAKRLDRPHARLRERAKRRPSQKKT